MECVYLVSENGTLSRSNDRFVFKLHDMPDRVIFPHLTRCIISIGQIQITGAAFRLLMRKEIPVFFLSRNGKYEGRLSFGEGKNVFLRNKEHVLANDPEWCLQTAKSIVKGKVLNQMRYVRRICGKSDECDKYYQRLRRYSTRIDDAPDIKKARGIEGAAAQAYFSALQANLPEWTMFSGRNMNPPRDPVNSVLSFVYTLLSYKVESEIIISGMDPSVGTLHSFCYGRNSLAFDIMEQFRTPICDTVTCSLFNLRILAKEDFRIVFANGEEVVDWEPDSAASGEFNLDNLIRSEMPYAVLLKSEAAKKVIGALESKLKEKVAGGNGTSARTYESHISEQVRRYKERVLKGCPYKSFAMK